MLHYHQRRTNEQVLAEYATIFSSLAQDRRRSRHNDFAIFADSIVGTAIYQEYFTYRKPTNTAGILSLCYLQRLSKTAEMQYSLVGLNSTTPQANLTGFSRWRIQFNYRVVGRLLQSRAYLLSRL